LAIIGLALLRVISSKASALQYIIALPTTNIFSRKGWILGASKLLQQPHLIHNISYYCRKKLLTDDGKQFSVILPFVVGCIIKGLKVL
jgi:hypothetical protein